MKKIFVVLLLLINCFANENCGCDVWFTISDPDTKGTNIRTAPKGAVLLTVPVAKESFHSVHAVEFQNGWWRIDSLAYELGKQKPLKQAWIHNSVVSTGLDEGEILVSDTGFVIDSEGKFRLTTPIYSAPSYKSKTGKIRQGSVEIIGCHKSWLKIIQTYNGKKTIGWWSPEDQCYNTLTNCCNGDSGEKTGTDSWGNQ